jgi:hypothetical protein
VITISRAKFIAETGGSVVDTPSSVKLGTWVLGGAGAKSWVCGTAKVPVLKWGSGN